MAARQGAAQEGEAELGQAASVQVEAGAETVATGTTGAFKASSRSTMGQGILIGARRNVSNTPATVEVTCNRELERRAGQAGEETSEGSRPLLII